MLNKTFFKIGCQSASLLIIIGAAGGLYYLFNFKVIKLLGAKIKKMYFKKDYFIIL